MRITDKWFPLIGDTHQLFRLAKSVGYRIAAVPAEQFLRDLDPRGRLPAFVFGEIEQLLNMRNGRLVMAARNNIQIGRASCRERV